MPDPGILSVMPRFNRDILFGGTLTISLNFAIELLRSHCMVGNPGILVTPRAAFEGMTQGTEIVRSGAI